MENSKGNCSVPLISHALTLEREQLWKYETDEFNGVCEIAHDVMTVKCVFEAITNSFYDVLQINSVIVHRLAVPVSVERLAEMLASDFPGLFVTVSGRAVTHGWITSGVFHRHRDS